MISVNLHEAKTQLSHLLDLTRDGEKIVVCKRNIPYVELTPVKKSKPKRTLGNPTYRFKVPASFFEPLPEDILAAFEGETDDEA